MRSLRGSIVIVCSAILLYFVRYGSSILCYDCNSAFDPRCGEEFDSFSLGVVNCSLRDPPEHMPLLEPTLCRAIKMEIFGKSRVVRTCGYIADEEYSNQSCRRLSGIGDVFVTYCACDTDLCNGAVSHNTQQMSLFLICVAVILFV